MKIGYARVSTDRQSLASQIDDLTAAGCETIFKEKVSAVRKRDQFDALLAYARRGDAIVVTRLDRLARSTIQLLLLSKKLQEREIELISLSDSIDTTTPLGRAFFTFTAALAELERETILQRTRKGLEAARKSGKKSGRKRILTDAQIASIKHRVEAGEQQAAIARGFNIDPSTLSRAIKRYDKERAEKAKSGGNNKK